MVVCMNQTPERRIKMSVDLPQSLYKAVNGFAEDMGIPDATGRARIANVEIFRALVEVLIEDRGLRARVASRIINS
jgi:hypothetical protein